MKTIEDINLHTWFITRELEFSPKHFTTCTTPITVESKDWILDKLTGRFVITSTMCPSFEDPKEAVFYELKWG